MSILSTGIISIIVSGIKSFFSWLTFNEKNKNKKEKIKKLESAEKDLENACNNGDLADLIDASIKLGRERRKQ